MLPSSTAKQTRVNKKQEERGRRRRVEEES
jgi:hypothetical protein